MELGMIGLGRMGANMVRRLLRKKHQCVVFDRSPDAVKALVKEKAVGAKSIADMIQKYTRRDPNDRRPLPGFFALAQYGVFFPLPGMGARDDERLNSSSRLRTLELLPAQTVRAVLGVTY